MPRYKVNNKTYNLPENKVEAFLLRFPDAIAIKDEPQDFPTSTAADADVVQPMTASQAGYVEPEDTELPSVDTSSELPGDDKITLEQFKSMTPEEKNMLSYSDKQRLPRELYKENKYKNNIDFIDFSSENFDDLEIKEKTRLKEIAGQEIIEEYNSKGVVDFEISNEEIKNKA